MTGTQESAKEVMERLVDPNSLAIGQKENLCRWSIFKQVPQKAKDEIVSAGCANPKIDRAVGCMVGMAVADAVGPHD